MDNWGAALYGDPCSECGYTWATSVDELLGVVRMYASDVAALVADATGDERIDELDWTVAAYIAHVSDNLSIWAERLVGVARGALPHVAPYDEQLLATARHYNELRLQGVTWSLGTACDRWIAAVAEARRAGIVVQHSERGPMSIDEVVRANTHDAIHHVWDIRRILQPD